MPTSILEGFSDLDKLRIDMETYFGQLHKEIREDERYLKLDFRELLNIPSAFIRDAVVLPTAREVVDTATDHITPKFRRVQVPRRSTETEKGTEQALKLRRFYESLLNWLEDQFTVSPFRMAVKHMSGVGLSTWRFDFDKQRHPDRPTRNQFELEDDFNEAMIEWRQTREENLPFALRVLHPTEVYFDPFHDPPEWAIQKSMRYVYDAERIYPHWGNPNGKKRSDKVEILDFWDAHFRAVSIDKKPGLKTRNGEGILQHRWGIHPFIIGGSGLGYEDADKSAATRYSGFIRIIRDVLRSESRNFSIQDIVLKAGAWPQRTATGEQANQVANIKWEYGKIHPIPEGVEIGELAPSLPPQIVYSALQIANQIISGATAPRVARGLQQPGLRSGFDRQVALGQSTLRYQPLADSTEHMMSQLLRNAGFLMERVIKEPISIAIGAQQDEFLRVSGNDFKGHHAVKVKINVLEPSDEIRKMQNVISMVTSGLMSPQTAIRENLPNVDPDQELGRIIASRVMFSEPMMALLSQASVQEVAEGLGITDILEALLTGDEEGQQPQRRSAAPESGNREAKGAGSRSDQAALRQGDLRETGGLQ